MAAMERSSNGTAFKLSDDLDPLQRWINLDRLSDGCESVGAMIVRSSQVRKVLTTIARLAPYRSTVLIQGESGTGKELVARALHSLSTRAEGPFVNCSCSALSDPQAGSQLFGYAKGSHDDSTGYFRQADGGTLFLDEIADLPLSLQPQILRAIESREVVLVGSTESHHVDIRLITSTNRDLNAMVKAGQFDEELYQRLNAAAIVVPPLRERREAIPGLIAHFIRHYNLQFSKELTTIDRFAVDTLTGYSWPGNVRELEHAIESAVLMAEGARLRDSDLPPHLSNPSARIPIDALSAAFDVGDVDPQAGESPEGLQSYSLAAAIHRASRKALVRALEAAGGNCYRAATLLGVSRYTVYRMLNRYGLAETRGYRTGKGGALNGKVG
jgi:two-component system, NtrC family, response regulator AtoC